MTDFCRKIQKRDLGCLAFALSFFLLVGGCIFLEENLAKRILVLDGVDRVMMHTTNSYSFLIGGKFQTYRINEDDGGGECVEFIYDIPPEKKSWVQVIVKDSYLGNSRVLHLTIHLHSPTDIVGGGWDHGKFGHGQNTVVE